MNFPAPDVASPPLPERRPAAALRGKQRRHLRALAHGLSPLVRIGHEGVSAGVLEATRAALETHELVKVKLLDGAPVGRDDAGEELAAGCGAHLAGTVGRVLILYRRHPERPRITLPR
ncbi:MAG: YhbY family RNA-binding protein [Myxococcota bacterium]